MKQIFLAMALCLVPTLAGAQTKSVAWDYTGNPALDVATAKTFTVTMAVDTQLPATVVPTCTQTTLVSCETPLPTLTAGKHTIVITAVTPEGSTSGSVTTGNPPSTITNMRIVIHITVPGGDQ